jgi:hypothetical protein
MLNYSDKEARHSSALQVVFFFRVWERGGD